MTANPKITFVGAGSTVFMKNIVGDVLQRPALAGATHRADGRQSASGSTKSAIVARKLIATLDVPAKVETYTDQRKALDGADFVVVAFQIGGYEPCTVTDFEVPKKYGLRHTIADTLGVGGIMRGLRTVPHLWKLCEDMLAVCPDAIMLQYVNPMAINTWAIAEKYPQIRQVGLCHSVQGTAEELANDLDIPDRAHPLPLGRHQPHGLLSQLRGGDGGRQLSRPLSRPASRHIAEGRAPKPGWNPRCPNKVRYEMLTRVGYFVTESSEHFAEYTPWFIKHDRPDLIEKFGIPLDEYPKRCIEQIDRWKSQADEYRTADRIEVAASREYASSIMNSAWTGEPSVIYGNVRNNGYITSLPARLRRRGALPGRPQRHPADPYRRHPAAACRHDAHQHQRAGADGRGADGGEPRAHLPRRDDGPAHRRRTRSRPDLEPGRRSARRAWRLAAAVGARRPEEARGRGIGGNRGRGEE